VSRLDDLPPDLRAALSLVLRQRRSYGELAGLLGIEQHAVHDRAHAALALLAPRQARALSAAQREQVGEYLLGQLDAGGRLQARDYLEGSEPARAWAQALTVELSPLAAQGLPDIPGPAASGLPASVRPGSGRPAETPTPEVPAAGPAESASPPTTPSSRTGGALVLAAIAAIVVVAVLLIVGVGGGGGGSHPGTTDTTAAGGSTATGPSGSAGAGAGATGATTGASTSAATTVTGPSGSPGGTSHSKALPLTPPDPSTSKALGVAYVLSEKGQRAFYIFSKGLPAPASGAFYAVWLEGAPGAPDYPLGSLPPAGSDGLIEGGGPLPGEAGKYTRIVVTVETSHKPTQPGPAVLGGRFSLS
jgi:hypothetical protein